jgi:hypothetical protein
MKNEAMRTSRPYWAAQHNWYWLSRKQACNILHGNLAVLFSVFPWQCFLWNFGCDLLKNEKSVSMATQVEMRSLVYHHRKRRIPAS